MIHKTAVNITRLNQTVLGQDRLMRTFTFTIRLIKVHLLNKFYSDVKLDSLCKKCDILCAQFTMTRRILRWSRTAYYIQVLITHWKKKQSKKNKLKLIRHYTELLFYSFVIFTDINDFSLWLCQLGLCNKQTLLNFNKDISPYLYVCEVIGWISVLIMEFYQIDNTVNKINQIDNTHNIQNKVNKIKKPCPPNKIKNLLHRQQQVKQNLIKYSLDLPVSYSYIDPKLIPLSKAVILGTISSFISLYQTFAQVQGGYQ